MGPHSCSQLSCWISDTDLAEGFSNTVASLQTQGFSLGTGLPGGRGGWQMLPSPPAHKAWGAIPAPGAPLGSVRRGGKCGHVRGPESSKIIPSANSHFPRKRASIARSIPFLQKGF